MEVSTTCYFSCTLVPLRASRYKFFPYISFAVTSTGLISERYLTAVSRLVYMNRKRRWYVGIPALGESPLLFFLDGKPPRGQ
jgi:hypothetical protein